jgi:hypothetical protein
MRVNMFHWRAPSDAQPRSKNGWPPHSTTGVAITSSIHSLLRSGRNVRLHGSAIAAKTNGSVNAAQIQRRLVMEINSSLGNSSAEIARGSSAIPQIGQLAGPCAVTSGCIGQVYSPQAAGSAVTVDVCGAETGIAGRPPCVIPTVAAEGFAIAEGPRTISGFPEGAGRAIRYFAGSAWNFPAQEGQQKKNVRPSCSTRAGAFSESTCMPQTTSRSIIQIAIAPKSACSNGINDPRLNPPECPATPPNRCFRRRRRFCFLAIRDFPKNSNRQSFMYYFQMY